MSAQETARMSASSAAAMVGIETMKIRVATPEKNCPMIALTRSSTSVCLVMLERSAAIVARARRAYHAGVIGIEFSTFSLIGRCERTGMFGIAIATSEMAVGSRCIHVAPGVGAVVTQASTNPRLGHLGLNLLCAGYPAPRVLEEIAASDPFVERRQLGCLDVTGLAAARTGADNKPWAGHRVERNVVVAANAVVSEKVADAMFGVFQAGADVALWERLVRALEAGKAAGG